MELIVLDEVDSTNDEARRLLRRGLAPGFAVVARRQTTGRGRLRRVWIAPPGNLSLTVASSWARDRSDGPTVAPMPLLSEVRLREAARGDRWFGGTVRAPPAFGLRHVEVC